MDQTINPFSNGVTQAIWNGVPPNYIGSHGALITDVTTGYLYQKSGGIWNLVCNKGVVVLAQSAVPASVTGTVGQTIVVQDVIPAGSLNVGSELLARVYVTHSGTGTVAIRVNASDGTNNIQWVSGTTPVGTILAQFENGIPLIGIKSQISAALVSPTTGGVAYTASTLDETKAWTVNWSLQQSVGSDTSTIVFRKLTMSNP